MSKSFAIIGGDLAIGKGRAYESVDGQDKLIQDLSLWILERVGTDPATPSFGSRLDGGVINGEPVESIIGQAMTQEMVFEVKLQIIELIDKYRHYQLDKIQGEMAHYGESTIKPEETISRIGQVEALVLGDTIAVRAWLRTLAGRNLKLTLPIPLS